MWIKRLTVGAFFMALTFVLSASVFSIAVPGGHLYFNGMVIFLVGLLFRPMEAVVIAGIGSFLGDLIFYPEAMFVTLLTHSLQVWAMAMILRKDNHPKAWKISLALFVGALIDLVGYGLGRAFWYRTPAYAIAKLPFDLLQVVLGVVVAYLIYHHPSFKRLWDKEMVEK